MPVLELPLPYAFRTLRTPARHKAYYGGRGGAKSWSIAADLINRGAESPTRILCCREVQHSLTGSVKQLLEDRIKAAKLENFYRITRDEISAPNGTLFRFAGLRNNPEAVRSMEGLDIAWVEEANTVSQRSIDLLTPTIRKDNSEIWFSWNRRFTSDPVDNMFLGGTPPPRSIVQKVGWQDNPWFPEVLRTDMDWTKARDYNKYLHVWEGEPIISDESRVFSNWRIDDIDDQMPPNTTPRLGADWGYAVDPTVLIECYQWGRVLYFRREAYKVRCEIDETPALFAGDDTHKPPRWENKFQHPGIPSARSGHRIVADSARPETISYMKNHGFRILRAKKGRGSVEDGIEFMKSHDIIVHPDAKHTTDELALYSWKTDPRTDEILPVLADKKNHVIDASRYALEGVRRAGGGRVAATAPQLVALD